MLHADDFLHHIEAKDRTTIGERARFLYGNQTYDTAIPEGWVIWALGQKPEYTRYQLTSQFIWLYPSGQVMGQPAPLTEEACYILEDLEKIQRPAY